ncbi:MAG: hypothetical protein ACI8PZ_004111 [Myxococcota bacterium]|jgi:hypothetical protein
MIRSLFVLCAVSAAGAAGAQTLDMSGECPGVVDISISGFTPGGTAVFLFGAAGEGSDVIGIGSCAGTVTGLAGVRFAARVEADGAGNASFSPSVGDARCDTPVQVLDTSTCTLSNVDTAASGVPGDINTFEWNGREGWLLYDYGIAGEAESAEFACVEEGFSGATDWDTAFIALAPWTCWCYDPAGAVISPCCSGPGSEAWFITDIRCY